MSKVHILTVSDVLDVEVICPGFDEFCQAYVECHSNECDVEKLGQMAYDDGDDEPVLHGVSHYVLPWCFGVKEGTDCFVANYHDLGALAEEFLEHHGLGPGKYLVEHAIDGDEGGIERLELVKSWEQIRPKDALSINLSEFPDTMAPLNELDEPCPWPWEPQQLVGAPLGQFHCGYCGGFAMAGMPHFDNRGMDEQYEREMQAQEARGNRPIDLSDPFADRPAS